MAGIYHGKKFNIWKSFSMKIKYRFIVITVYTER